jgi:hypothetical protein
MPQTPGGAHRLTQRLQKYWVGGQNNQLDNVACEAELQRIQSLAFFIRSQHSLFPYIS